MSISAEIELKEILEQVNQKLDHLQKDITNIKIEVNETVQEIRTLKGHTDSVISVTISNDGKTLTSGSFDKTIKLWNLDTEPLMRRACDWVRAYLTSNPNVSESDRHLCDDIGSQAQDF